MSGLSYPPGERLLFLDDLGERDDLRFVLPLIEAEMQGIQVRRIQPGGDLERPSLPIVWIVIVDDRAPDASGPSSFDPITLRWLFSDAFAIALDAAEPDTGIYEYIVTHALKRAPILVIQTIEGRLEMWRAFSQQNTELYGVMEFVPVRHNPERRLAASVTRFPGRTAPPR